MEIIKLGKTVIPTKDLECKVCETTFRVVPKDVQADEYIRRTWCICPNCGIRVSVPMPLRKVPNWNKVGPRYDLKFDEDNADDFSLMVHRLLTF